MPVEGHKVVTVSQQIHSKAEKFREEYNRKVGWKEIRSLSHLFELAVIDYMKRNGLEE